MTIAPPVDPTRRTARTSTFGTLVRRPLFLISAGYLIVLVMCALFAEKLAPYPPDAQDLARTLDTPSADHLLGTDTLGRDVLSRLLFGIEPTLVGTVQAVAVFLAIGLPLGLVAGYGGGRVDAAVMRVAELVMSIPPIIVVLVVLVVFGGEPTAAMISLGVLGSPGLIRVVCGAAASVKTELFVTAAQVSGVGAFTIVRTHILRRVRGPLLVQVSLFAAVALGFQAVLGFLGLLSEGGTPTWGGSVAEAAGVITRSSWLLVPPGVAITLAILAFGALGDIARDMSSDADRPRGRAPVPAKIHTAPSTVAQHEVDMDRSDALLTVHGLTTKSWPGTALVTDVSFTVRSGETVGLVGESGCGKSVTALSVLGLLPAGLTISAGSIEFEGKDLLAAGSDAYRSIRGSGIAYISQDPMGALDPTHTVASLLDEVISKHDNSSKTTRRQRAIELLAQVRINDAERVLSSYAHQISGGMAQRVAIAIALAGRPRLIVADEPTTALDVTVQSEILALLRNLKSTNDLAILLITHDWGVVADICDRVAVMYAGEIVETAEVHDIFDHPAHPYTKALLASDLSLSPAAERLPALPGRVPTPEEWPSGCRFASRCEYVRDECVSATIPLISTQRVLHTHSDGFARCIRVDASHHLEGSAS